MKRAQLDTEYQGKDVKYMANNNWLPKPLKPKCYLILHDYPSLVEGESHGVLLFN